MRAARLDIRTTSATKGTLENAALFLGTTVSAFILESAMEKATRVLQDAQTIQLTTSEHERFLHSLDHPKAPNRHLKALFAKHKNAL